MLNKLDKIMLAVLLALLVSSAGMHWQDQVKQPVDPKAVVRMVDKVVAPQPTSQVPDFGSMMDVKAKKNAFFGYMHPLVEKENYVILKNRQHIITLSTLTELAENDKVWLANLAKKYRLRSAPAFDEVFFQALLTRVDMIPPSLALAQSANETAWGTSRFAKQGNNFFGQWCFRSGCGIVPAARPEGETYEVQKFENVAASVRAYMHNLNTNHQYEVLRELREKRRITKKSITGPVLVHGLYAYSTRGVEYIAELLSMINSNDLLQYDLDHQAGLVTSKT